MAKDDAKGDGGARYPVTADSINIDDDSQELALIDQVLEQGNEHMKVRWRELIDNHIIDPQGNLLKEELPPDMHEGSERDFGG
jgi:hypothetical protein